MTIMLTQENRTPAELSREVCHHIIRIAAESGGMGWLDVEETLREVFSDEVNVEDDGHAGVTLISQKKEDR
jgi:hypothetical protein